MFQFCSQPPFKVIPVIPIGVSLWPVGVGVWLVLWVLGVGGWFLLRS
jgi:hypothetical protein